MHNTIISTQADIIARLQAALEFYAHHGTYHWLYVDVDKTEIGADRGNMARKALVKCGLTPDFCEWQEKKSALPTSD